MPNDNNIYFGVLQHENEFIFLLLKNSLRIYGFVSTIQKKCLTGWWNMDLCNIHEIKELLTRHGFRFSKSMGQNFLVASWVPERIVAESGIDLQSGVLEIGPGIGCLTQHLSQTASRVVAVELDKTLLPLLEESLENCDNVKIINSDVLKLNLSDVVDTYFSGLLPVVCANLPYNITTPILSALIDTQRFTTITVMIQREVARRICAKAGTPDYGAFTVYVNYYMQPEILFDVAPGCFIPQPSVYSSVIKMSKREVPPAVVQNEKLFFQIVRASFTQRRKTLLNGLFSIFGQKLTKEQLSGLIQACGYDVRIRGETLDIPGFAKIANAIAEVLQCG